MLSKTDFKTPLGKHSLTFRANSLKDLLGKTIIQGLQSGIPALNDPKYMTYLLENNVDLLADLSINPSTNLGASYRNNKPTLYGRLGEHVVSYEPETNRIGYRGSIGKYNVGAYHGGKGSKDWGINVSFPVDI